MRRSHPVLIPYEITLLSNGFHCCTDCSVVLIPYEITLLSNKYEQKERN